MLGSALRSAGLTREDELAVRSALAEAWLLQDDLDQAASALGRTPDTFRDTISAARLSTLWRLHGRLASARGDQSRAIALHGRALKQAEAAHDSRSIRRASRGRSDRWCPLRAPPCSCRRRAADSTRARAGRDIRSSTESCRWC